MPSATGFWPPCAATCATTLRSARACRSTSWQWAAARADARGRSRAYPVSCNASWDYPPAVCPAVAAWRVGGVAIGGQFARAARARAANTTPLPTSRGQSSPSHQSSALPLASPPRSRRFPAGCTARATLVARHRRAVADAICISVRRATREYRVVEVHAGADASAMFKTLFEATEELAEVQSRLPKTAGRLPKRSALAACCLWTLCCGCCWMDDGSASASIKLKAKQKAAASRAAASPRHTGSGGGSSTGYRTLASPSPSSAGSAGASGRNDSAETPDADPLSIGPAAAPAGGDPLAASSSSSGHGRRSSAGHSRRSSGGSGHGRRLTGGGAATGASPRSGGPASDGGDVWVPRGSFGSDDGAFG